MYKKTLFSILLLAISLSSSAITYSKEPVKDKWQKDVPQKAISLTTKGRLKGKLMRFNAAIKNFQEALKLKEDYYWATFNLAIAYYMTSGEQRDLAEKTFLKAVKIARNYNIKDPLLYDTFGQFYQRYERFEEAVEQFKKALNIDKNNVNALNNIGAAYEAIKQNDKALESYQKAMKLGLPVAKVNYNRLNQQIEKEKREDLSQFPPTYFINKRAGDPKPPETYFDNDGAPGMAEK